jgi:hypothetical protein
MPMVLARPTVEGVRPLDRFFDPGDEPWVANPPFGEPSGEIAPDLLDAAPVHAALAQLLTTRVEDEVGEGLGEGARGESFEVDGGVELPRFDGRVWA